MRYDFMKFIIFDNLILCYSNAHEDFSEVELVQIVTSEGAPLHSGPLTHQYPDTTLHFRADAPESDDLVPFGQLILRKRRGTTTWSAVVLRRVLLSRSNVKWNLLEH